MSFASIEQSLLVSPEHQKKIYNSATSCRNKIVLEKDDGTFAPKVCCVCDRHIIHGNEMFLPEKYLYNECVQKCLRMDKEDWTLLNVTESIKTKLLNQYKQKFFNANHTATKKLLDSFMLSPETYSVKKKFEGEESLHLGCCTECRSHLQKVYTGNTVDKPPNAIANNKCFGYAPECLTRLNETELAMIAIARVNGHLINLHGGAHKGISGWHTLFDSDVGHTSKVMNYYEKCKRNKQDPSTLDDDADYVNAIQVILTGPFTHDQKQLAKLRCLVRPRFIREALIWLKANNRLYAHIDNDATAIVQPRILDCSTEVPSEDNNIEQQFDLTAVFVDPHPPTSNNGGHATNNAMKCNELENLINNENSTLRSKPTRNILRDYEDDNLLKAFPLQFPFGVGSYGVDVPVSLFYEYLNDLSSPNFHVAEFTTIIHNMWERNRLFRKTCIYTSKNEKMAIADVTDGDIDRYIDAYLAKEPIDGPGAKFIQRVKACTGSMEHTVAASKKNRCKVLGLATHFGLSSLMFTISPDDAMNYRIIIYSRKNLDVPDLSESDTALNEFVIECSKIRKQYPGLCAIDFQNILEIVIAEFLGYEKPNKGIFGEVEAYCVAVEEQGRKTLHSHILVWLKEWSKLMDWLGNQEKREEIQALFEAYTDSVLSTQMNSYMTPHDATFSFSKCEELECSGTMQHCSSQDLRNLRTRTGETEFGGKSIICCKNEACKVKLSSEEITMKNIKKVINNIGHKTDNSPFNYEQMHTHGSRRSKFNVALDITLMKKLQKEMINPKNAIPKFGSKAYAEKCFITSCLRNLHKSSHVPKCFKYKEYECRYNIPTKSCDSTKVIFDNKTVDWYDWHGTAGTRNLFATEHKRNHIDAFANRHNEIASVVFGSNTNVILGMLGGAMLYVALYASKNTHDEDVKDYAEAGVKMIQKVTASYGEELDNDDNLQRKQRGVRTILSACTMVTRCHKVSAPLASYIIRNGSRFRFSHDFTNIFLNKFVTMDKDIEDYVLQSADNNDGEVTKFFSSQISDYVCRPKKNKLFKDMCTYDFFMQYFSCRVTTQRDTQFKFTDDHPSKGNRVLSKRKGKKKIIPTLQYYTFPNSKSFGGLSIQDKVTDFDISDMRHASMEEYAKLVCILFCPFTTLDCIKKDGLHLLYLQEQLRLDKVLPEHLNILKNIQDCHNAMESGSPMDVLKGLTVTPPCDDTFCNSTQDNDAYNALRQYAEEWMFSMETLDSECSENFKDANGKFTMNTSIATGMGEHNCGKKLVVTPTVTQNKKAISATSVSQDAELWDEYTVHFPNRTLSDITFDELFLLQGIRKEINTVEVDGKNVLTIDANGTLENIQQYAVLTFEGDKDQELAFMNAAAAFVIKLYEKVLQNGVSRKKNRNGQFKINFSRPVAVIELEKHNAFLIDKNILALLQDFNNNEDAGENIALASLNLPSDTLVDIQYESGTTANVPISTLKLNLAAINDGGRSTANINLNELRDVLNNKKQFIGFLTGPGGTGKSRVINALRAYAKNLCTQLKVTCDRRTIITTAITGTAAVGIGGETTCSACGLRKSYANIKHSDEFDNSIMVIVDEVSFMNETDFNNLNRNLNILCDANESKDKFGNLQVLLAGDFAQLPPPKATPLFNCKNLDLWENHVNTYLPLRSNHRFKDDENWGEILSKFRNDGPSEEDVNFINSKVIDDGTKIPDNATYAVHKNINRCAINEAVFKKFLETNHTKDPNNIPDHSICIMSSITELQRKTHYEDCPDIIKNIVHASCSDVHVTKSGNPSEFIDPLLKLYVGRPMMINENIDVAHSMANGSVGTFERVKLKRGYQDVFKINIDGYYIHCVEAKDVEYLELKLESGKLIKLEAARMTADVQFPDTVDGFEINHRTHRTSHKFKLFQFPAITCNAITVHKLQGRSLDCIVASDWYYGPNWIYVLLSRLRTSAGLYVRDPLLHSKCKPMSQKCKVFIEKCTKKLPTYTDTRSHITSNN